MIKMRFLRIKNIYRTVFLKLHTVFFHELASQPFLMKTSKVSWNFLNHNFEGKHFSFVSAVSFITLYGFSSRRFFIFIIDTKLTRKIVLQHHVRHYNCSTISPRGLLTTSTVPLLFDEDERNRRLWSSIIDQVSQQWISSLKVLSLFPFRKRNSRRPRWSVVDQASQQ